MATGFGIFLFCSQVCSLISSTTTHSFSQTLSNALYVFLLLLIFLESRSTLWFPHSEFIRVSRAIQTFSPYFTINYNNSSFSVCELLLLNNTAFEEKCNVAILTFNLPQTNCSIQPQFNVRIIQNFNISAILTNYFLTWKIPYNIIQNYIPTHKKCRPFEFSTIITA